MSKIITEITPLSDKDCFYVVDRYKDSFTYPLHKHNEFELNFVENCSGARRIVGDSIVTLGQYDLCLIGPNLEHVWEQSRCTAKPIHEITIQFAKNLFGEEFLAKNQLSSIHKLLELAHTGIAFEMPAILRVYSMLNGMTQLSSGFYRMQSIIAILHELSTDGHFHTLSSSSFAQAPLPTDSRRVAKVEEYINKHFAQEIRLSTLSELAGMTPTAFSRFFKLRTGKTISDYIIDIRIGYAARRLADSTDTILEICYECGFNNVSNFNRIFKKRKGCSPKIFRENYHKTKTLL